MYCKSYVRVHICVSKLTTSSIIGTWRYASVLREDVKSRRDTSSLTEEGWAERAAWGDSGEKIALKALRSKALRLVRQKTTILGREDQAPATSRLTGSRAQAIPRHVTSRFGVALCFLNLRNGECGTCQQIDCRRHQHFLLATIGIYVPRGI